VGWGGVGWGRRERGTATSRLVNFVCSDCLSCPLLALRETGRGRGRDFRVHTHTYMHVCIYYTYFQVACFMMYFTQVSLSLSLSLSHSHTHTHTHTHTQTQMSNKGTHACTHATARAFEQVAQNRDRRLGRSSSESYCGGLLPLERERGRERKRERKRENLLGNEVHNGGSWARPGERHCF